MNAKHRKHNTLVDKLHDDLSHRYGIVSMKNVYYPLGELDLVRETEPGNYTIYEVKGSHSSRNLFKAYKQTLRAKVWFEEHGYKVSNLIYVSQKRNGDYITKRL